MQPTYLPWAGYFQLLAMADVFVFLDNVQFERRSWQSRNRILLNGSEHLLSVPVVKTTRDASISSIQTSDSHGDWRSQHFHVIAEAYRKAPFGQILLELVEPFYVADASPLLSEFNIRLIVALASALGITSRLLKASQMPVSGSRSHLLAGICNHLSAQEYLSPCGSREYLTKDGFESMTKAVLSFQDFTPVAYSQWRSDRFVSHLSIIDVIANLGLDGARAYLATI
jgi:hypothetical protein